MMKFHLAFYRKLSQSFVHKNNLRELRKWRADFDSVVSVDFLGSLNRHQRTVSVHDQKIFNIQKPIQYFCTLRQSRKQQLFAAICFQDLMFSWFDFLLEQKPLHSYPLNFSAENELFLTPNLSSFTDFSLTITRSENSMNSNTSIIVELNCGRKNTKVFEEFKLNPKLPHFDSAQKSRISRNTLPSCSLRFET